MDHPWLTLWLLLIAGLAAADRGAAMAEWWRARRLRAHDDGTDLLP